MGIINLPIGASNSGDAEWSDVHGEDQAIVDEVNGFLDNDNIAADAGIAISKLQSLTANIQTDDYTLTLSDAENVVEMNAATSKTITVPPNSSVAFPVGTVVEILRYGTGALTIAAGSGVTIRTPTGLTVSSQYSSASLRKRATDEWVLSGDVTS